MHHILLTNNRTGCMDCAIDLLDMTVVMIPNGCTNMTHGGTVNLTCPGGTLIYDGVIAQGDLVEVMCSDGVWNESSARDYRCPEGMYTTISQFMNIPMT